MVLRKSCVILRSRVGGNVDLTSSSVSTRVFNSTGVGARHFFLIIILPTTESWYSVTPEEIARRQAEVCSCHVIVDGYAGAGGNSIQFARTCGFVIGVDNCMDRLVNVLDSNARVYGVRSKIDTICGDLTLVLNALRMPPDDHSPIDTVFMSPPWGGPDYKARVLPPGAASWNKKRRKLWFESASDEIEQCYDLEGRIPFLAGAVTAARRLCPNRVAVYLPRHCALGQVLKLGWEGTADCTKRADVTIEDYWLRGRRLSICAYIGNFPKLSLADDSHQLEHYEAQQ
uniref:Trimethylguanosine synthase n=1 Tax=Mesocestoides corti TaxID=53468 RepID=A0A5K3EWV7_MESCO